MECSSVGSVAANPNEGKFLFTLNHYTRSVTERLPVLATLWARLLHHPPAQPLLAPLPLRSESRPDRSPAGPAPLHRFPAAGAILQGGRAGGPPPPGRTRPRQ